MRVEKTENGMSIHLTKREAKMVASGNLGILRTIGGAVRSNVEVTPKEAGDAIFERAAEISDREDRQDLRRVGALLRHGEVELARRCARGLDTAVRDEIPEVAWPFLGLSAV